jgi:hypothetical protein
MEGTDLLHQPLSFILQDRQTLMANMVLKDTSVPENELSFVGASGQLLPSLCTMKVNPVIHKSAVQ